MIGMAERVKADGITAESEWTEAPEWAAEERDGRSWYRVTLRMGRRTLTTPFGLYFAYSREPEVDEVINCLVSDAAGYESTQGFEDWAGDYGYEPDSETAEATYRQVKAQTAKLRRFLGEKFDAYLYETEGL